MPPESVSDRLVHVPPLYFRIYTRFRPCWGLVRSVRSRQGCFELFVFDIITANEDTGQKYTDVWAIEPWALVLVFATCKPDLTYRVLSYGTVVYASVLHSDPPSPEAPMGREHGSLDSR